MQGKKYKKQRLLWVICFCLIAIEPAHKAYADPSQMYLVSDIKRERGWRLKYFMAMLTIAFSHPVMM